MNKFNLKKRTKRFMQSLLVAALCGPWLLAGAAASAIVPPVAPVPAKIGWITYMEADNSLWPFSLLNVADIVAAQFSSGIRSFVVWDKPDDNITWRLELQSGASVDRGSFTGKADLGTNPKQELIDMSAWFCQWVNPQIIIVDLWSHGSGIEDPNLSKFNKPVSPSSYVPKSVIGARRGAAIQKLRALPLPTRNRRGQIQPPKKKQPARTQYPLIPLPGAESRWPGGASAVQKGFGFDTSQNTYLTTQSMKEAIAAIKKSIKRPIDILLFDACLMSMVEIVYQLNGLTQLIIASANSVPGDGMPYGAIFNWLGNNPDAVKAAIAMQIVMLFGQCYRDVAAHAIDQTLVRNAQRATLAALQVTAIAPLVDAFTSLASTVNACALVDVNKTKTAVRAVRTAITNMTTLQFDMNDYVDVRLLFQQFITVFSAFVPTATIVAPPASSMPPIALPALPLNPVTPPQEVPPVQPEAPLAPPAAPPEPPVSPVVSIDEPVDAVDTVPADAPINQEVVGDVAAPVGPVTDAPADTGTTDDAAAETKRAPKKTTKPAPKTTSNPVVKPPAKPTAKPKPVVKPVAKPQATSKSAAKPVTTPAKKGMVDYASQAQRVVDVATAGLNALSNVILLSTAGVGLANSCGLNVYYPAQGPVDASYRNNDFAKKTGWDAFIAKYQ